MRSLLLKSITVPVAFKAIRESRRAQLWNRQASIMMDLTRFGPSSRFGRHHKHRYWDRKAGLVGIKGGTLRLDADRVTHHRLRNDRIDGWALLARQQTWELELPILWLRKTFWMRWDGTQENPMKVIARRQQSWASIVWHWRRGCTVLIHFNGASWRADSLKKWSWSESWKLTLRQILTGHHGRWKAFGWTAPAGRQERWALDGHRWVAAEREEMGLTFGAIRTWPRLNFKSHSLLP